MIRRLAMLSVVLGSVFAFDLADADAARRRGGFFRRTKVTRTTYRSNSTYRTRSNRAPKLHETHSRSAVLDGFFGPSPGMQGHDRSWYVGR